MFLRLSQRGKAANQTGPLHFPCPLCASVPLWWKLFWQSFGDHEFNHRDTEGTERANNSDGSTMYYLHDLWVSALKNKRTKIMNNEAEIHSDQQEVAEGTEM